MLFVVGALVTIGTVMVFVLVAILIAADVVTVNAVPWAQIFVGIIACGFMCLVSYTSDTSSVDEINRGPILTILCSF